MTRFPATILFLSTITLSLAEDWPQWRGPVRTGYVTDAAAVVTKLPDDPKTTWKLAIGDGFASPVVAGGKVFTWIIKARTRWHMRWRRLGKELWQEKIFASHKDGFGIGPRTTPLVDGNGCISNRLAGNCNAENRRWETGLAEKFRD